MAGIHHGWKSSCKVVRVVYEWNFNVLNPFMRDSLTFHSCLLMYTHALQSIFLFAVYMTLLRSLLPARSYISGLKGIHLHIQSAWFLCPRWDIAMVPCLPLDMHSCSNLKPASIWSQLSMVMARCTNIKLQSNILHTTICIIMWCLLLYTYVAKELQKSRAEFHTSQTNISSLHGSHTS